jgi:TolB-like protein/class 3 adenylate cyclase
MSALRLDRRLAAILVADVVGYSRLIEHDEAGTLERLKALRKKIIEPILAAHEGRIVKLMGDGALVEFPSASEAVLAAVEIQKAVADHNGNQPETEQIRFRLGISLGDVVHEDDDIFGEGVNLAARLQTIASPGGICVARNVYEQVRNRLPVGFAAMGPQRVKNFADPVHTYRVLSQPGDDAERGKFHLRTPKRLWGAGLASALILVIASILLWLQPWAARELPTETGVESASLERPSIAVLPFVNISDDAKQEFFVDGLTEDLITDLAKISSLFVISRNSVFTYKGKAMKARQVAAELGVRYVLEGSVRRAGDTIRVSAQLLDARNDRHLWAERYDRHLEDVFAVQDEVERQIVTALAVHLSAREQAQLAERPTSSIEAYEYYLRARQAMLEGEQRSLQLAYWAFKKAIELDPKFAEAYAGLAMANAIDYSGGSRWSDWARPPNTTHATVERMSQRALALKPGLALAELAMVRLRLADFRFDDARRHIERAVTLEPGSSEVLNFHARVLTALGRHAEAMPVIDEAFRRNPKAPADQYETLGMIQFALGEYPAAKASLIRAFGLMSVSPNWMTAAFLAATYGFTGEPLTASVARYTPPLNDVILFPFYQTPADQNHLLDGLRRAKVPEFPLGFSLPDHAGRRLQGTELEARLYGRRFSTWCPALELNGAIVFDPSGMMTWQLRHDFSDTGPSQLRNDRLCATFPVLTRGREACFSIFEIDADKSSKGDNSFVLAGPELCHLSPTE